MIKLIAAITMLIDHIGAILFPKYEFLRLIGRVSMPLFGYCIARGFYYSEKKGSLKRYLKNLFIFSVISQIPFTFVSILIFNEFELNIGFVWFLSVIFLIAMRKIKLPLNGKNFVYILMIISIFLFCKFVPMDYGFYALLFPVIFYYFIYKNKNYLYLIISSFFVYIYYIFSSLIPICIKNKIDLINLLIINGQYYSILSSFFVLFIKKDNKDLLPRRFFYWFYPAHLSILIIIRQVLVLNGLKIG